jgi:hypothetical protein
LFDNFYTISQVIFKDEDLSTAPVIKIWVSHPKTKIVVFKKKVLRKIFGPKREKMEKKLHNDELLNLSSSPNIIEVSKSRRIQGAGYAACMREMKNACKILSQI